MIGPTWLVATHNRGKLQEIQALLGDCIHLVGAASAGVRSPEETATTFVENALAKARHGAATSGLPTIADDSGLVVDALGGGPGVRSARYAGDNASDADNVTQLLAALEEVPTQLRTARFICVVVALQSVDDPTPLIAQGTWQGLITQQPRGHGGFGYDPIFEDLDTGLTAAELSSASKNERSHRGQALQALQRHFNP
jgi:XTP/dITP diphosphohydrolase